MTRFDLLDEYSTIILPGYWSGHWEVDEAEARRASAWLKGMVLLVFGGVLIGASLHGLLGGAPEFAMPAAAGGDLPKSGLIPPP